MAGRILIALLLGTGSVLQAQILKPTTWSWRAEKNSVKSGEELDLIFTVTTDKNWYVYANDFDPDCGPMLTTVTFEKNNSFELVGGLKAINPIAKHDEIFGCDVKIFKNTGEFRQRIKVLTANLKLAGVIEGQTCT